MRTKLLFLVLMVWAGPELSSSEAAQSVTTIHNVTLREDAGAGVVMTIAGTGFGRTPLVTVDGEPVAVLPGGTTGQIDVAAPAAVLARPGTYRLTVVDPARQAGDTFVVSSAAVAVLTAGQPAGTARTPSASDKGSTILPSTFAASPSGPAPLVVEDSGSPYRTAIGYRALFSNTTGNFNSAVGASALYSNTTGRENTATGVQALVWNSTGSNNTANGVDALYNNSTGERNTAIGTGALLTNNTGWDNTASGTLALYANTTGGGNTAGGRIALLANTTGNYNTAFGLGAGSNATIGSHNLFLGAFVAGAATDANTIRIGLPYGGGTGQNRTFIAGIKDVSLSGAAVPVWIDANGQLGTLPTGTTSGGSGNTSFPQLQQQVRDQQTTIADLTARLARLEALLAPGRP